MKHFCPNCNERLVTIFGFDCRGNVRPHYYRCPNCDWPYYRMTSPASLRSATSPTGRGDVALSTTWRGSAKRLGEVKENER